MKRENTNLIRFLLEEIIPPIIRDSLLFKLIVNKFYRKDKTHEILKSNILNISEDEYENYYKNMPRVNNETDLSDICINEILKNIVPEKIIDIGCGDGFLLNKIKEKYNDSILYGTEITISQKLKNSSSEKGLKIIKKKIENINEIELKFDTVICSHVLEHIFDINLAYENLKKICKKKLIIVIPRERAYQYTFNGHLHFFPYKWSFINTIRPKNKFQIKDLKRDLFYIEELNDHI